ncbi:MAG: 2-C-methyl-D-erythritol 4-phosphate cytidylyltransferase [Planctomycetota bacterium]|nr:MAG: 2-C-methyl-D-erythritol 4-phosphate cytidylyltransferase [Planctomycetota bacterium]
MSAKKVSVIVCAAGSSRRFGGDRKKPFVDISGRAAFVRSIEYFAERDDVCQVILAISAADEESVKVKWGASLAFNGVKLCYGGAERFETVAKAIELVKDEADLIAVHDAVRCCLTKDWLDELFATAAETGAAMLACPVVATLKKVEDGKIIDTVDRSNLYEAQTPQVFDAELLKKAYAKLESLDKSKITDDAQLVEAMGQTVHIVETDHSNIKITRKNDVAIAEAIIKSRPKPKAKGPSGPYSEEDMWR